MRTGLIVFGIIFLVLGAAAYYYPTQTVSSSFTIPVEWSYASMAIGALLLLFGLIIPAPVNGAVQGLRGPRGRSYRRAVRRRSRRIPRGTTVTTTRTTRTKR